MQKATVKLVIDKPKSNGEAPIYVRVTINRKRKYIHTGKPVEPRYWDEKNSTVKLSKNLPNCRVIKRVMENKKTEVDQLIAKMEIEGKMISFDGIIAEMEGGMNKSFFEYCVERISADRKRGVIKESTFKLYRAKMQRVYEFDHQTHIGEVDRLWLERFQSYLIEVRGIENGTIYIYMAVLRKVLNHATRQNHIRRNPFINFEPIKLKPKEREYLSIEELRKLNSIYESEELRDFTRPMKDGRRRRFRDRVHNVLFTFLVGCYTGLRFLDLIHLGGKTSMKII